MNIKNNINRDESKSQIQKDLENIRQLKQELEEQEERLIQYEEEAYSLTSSMSRLGATSEIKSHHTNDMMAESVAKMMDLNKYINSVLADYYYSIEKVEKSLDILSSLQRRLLRLYYIDGMTSDKVAEVIGYDRRSFFRIRKKALDLLEEYFSRNS